MLDVCRALRRWTRSTGRRPNSRSPSRAWRSSPRRGRRSLDSAGLLLLGEIHGVPENPLLIRALMQAFGLTSLALERPEDLRR